MSLEPGAALRSWLERGDISEAALRRQTLRELNSLLDLDLDLDLDLNAFFQDLGRRLARLPAGPAALIQFLAPDPQRPGASLAEALAEILTVPRRQRSEYLTRPGATLPWEIKRLLLEYAHWSARLDRCLGVLTQEFCASRCQRPPLLLGSGHVAPVGCCSVLGYDMGLVTGGMLRAQELEARAGGWTPPDVEEYCKYLGPRGCRLRLFKSPACAGMLCDELQDHLRRRHEPRSVEAFLEPLARYRNMVLDREAIFRCMGQVVAAAEGLL